MTDLSTPAGPATLVGLWDFGGSDASDAQVAAGLAPPAPHAGTLQQGTLFVSFVADHVQPGAPSRLMGLGPEAPEGALFEVAVTAEGRVTIFHAAPYGPVAALATDAGLVAPGDRATLIYAWNAQSGAVLSVDNETTGASSSAAHADPGLVLPIGHDPHTAFAFGTQTSDGSGLGAFTAGGLDHVALYDADVGDGDFVVEGTAGPDLIDTDYSGDPDGDRIDAGDGPGGTDRDLVDAGAGDDTVRAGAAEDTVFAGAGDDLVEGEAGDDVLRGDAVLSGTVRESFEWDLAPAPGGTGVVGDEETIGDFTQDTGSVDVAFSVTAPSDRVLNRFEDTEQAVSGIDTGGASPDARSSFNSDGLGDGATESYALDFSSPVRNVAFRINDVDLGSVATVRAFGPTGEPLQVGVTTGSRLEGRDTDDVPGVDTGASTGGARPDSSLEYSMLVEIPGPVSRIEIVHLQEGGGRSGINVTDVWFDAPAVAAAGDDTLDGGEGDDLLLGEGGDDVLIGGAGDDTLDGGTGRDTLQGGPGNDSITDPDGDTRVESGKEGLPDRGFPFFGNPDPDPFDDRDTVTTGAGDDTILTGDDEDVISSGGGDDLIDGGFDDDLIDSGDGDDFVVGGEGADTIATGAGDDTVYGGLETEIGEIVNLIDENVDPARNDPLPANARDLIDAGAGDDLVFGQDDDDTIDGGAGDDTIDGGVDDDLVRGGAGDDLLTGGQGADTIKGGFGDDTVKSGTFTDPIFGDDYVEGVGDLVKGGEDPDDKDIDVLDLRGSGPLKILFEDSIDPGGEAGESGRVIFYKDAGRTEKAGELVFKEIENVIPCFTPGALIATPRGEVAVETLRAGDRVLTRDNGIQEIRWIGSRTLTRAELLGAPHLRPVLIRKGALGDGLPERDMVVSPQHRVLIAGRAPQLYFAESEVLVAAKHLVGRPGIEALESLRATYVHFLFDRHEVVLSDGSWTESFQPGDMTLGAMGEAQRGEIVELFPELADHVGRRGYAAARRALKGHEARLLQF